MPCNEALTLPVKIPSLNFVFSAANPKHFTLVPGPNIFNLTPTGDGKHENLNLMYKLHIHYNYHLIKINPNKDLNTQVQCLLNSIIRKLQT